MIIRRRNSPDFCQKRKRILIRHDFFKHTLEGLVEFFASDEFVRSPAGVGAVFADVGKKFAEFVVGEGDEITFLLDFGEEVF